MGQFHMRIAAQELDTLVQSSLTKVIIENWRNRPWTKNRKNNNMHNWNDNQTSRNIGKVELMCEMRQVPLEKVEPVEKPVGYAWAGITPPSDHRISHQFDAYAHGVCWLQKNGINPPGKFLKGKT